LFERKHLIAKATAQLNLSELSKTLGILDTLVTGLTTAGENDQLTCENNISQKKLLLEGNDNGLFSLNDSKKKVYGLSFLK